MKRIKKMAALMMAVIMALAMSVTVFAQDQSGTGGNGKITINNPAKGETYWLFKLFDATVGNGTIAYTGNVPEGLESFFNKNATTGYITPNESIVSEDGTTTMTDGLKAALETWANKQKKDDAAATAVSDGSVLNFNNMPYGYYVMVTSHKSDAVGNAEPKSFISVTSTTPSVEINDKNENEPSADKTVDKRTYNIGDTIQYTATFGTTNYMTDADGDKWQVIDYEISDTLPEFLSDATVTEITIDGTEYKVNGEVPQFSADKKIVIPWATKAGDNYTSNYKQGAQIVVTYTAVLTSTTNVGVVDTNEVSILPYVDRGGNTPDPWEKPWSDKEEIETYAAAINKVDENGAPLAGAVFTVAGLQTEPAKDAEDKDIPGVYKVVRYDLRTKIAPTEMSTDENGKLYILGLDGETEFNITEAVAPDGYNKLDAPQPFKAQLLEKEIIESSGTRYYDTDGNLVNETSTSFSNKEVTRNLEDLDTNAVKITNQQGSLLPSTGGIGTTIFYIVGAILVIGAGVILVAKKRMSQEQ